MDELACIFIKLKLKNATLTAENTRMQKELEAEHALAETLGHGLEQAKDENDKLRECLQEFADLIKNDDGFGVDQGWMLERMSEIGIRGQ